MIVVRYADDSVAGFESKADVERFLETLKVRFAKFGLSLNGEKTRVLEFGRFAAQHCAQRGLRRPQTFDFLGFTHICGVTRTNGRFTVMRLTSSKRMRATLKALRQTLKRRQHEPIPVIGKWLRRVIQGYFNYHAVPGNSLRLSTFRRKSAGPGCMPCGGVVSTVVCPGRGSCDTSRAMFRRFAYFILTRISALRHDSRQEPYAVVPHVRICAGGGEQPPSLPRSKRKLTVTIQPVGTQLGERRQGMEGAHSASGAATDTLAPRSTCRTCEGSRRPWGRACNRILRGHCRSPSRVRSATSASNSANTPPGASDSPRVHSARSVIAASMLTASSSGGIAASGGCNSDSRPVRRLRSHSHAASIHASRCCAVCVPSLAASISACNSLSLISASAALTARRSVSISALCAVRAVHADSDCPLDLLLGVYAVASYDAMSTAPMRMTMVQEHYGYRQEERRCLSRGSPRVLRPALLCQCCRVVISIPIEHDRSDKPRERG